MGLFGKLAPELGIGTVIVAHHIAVGVGAGGAGRTSGGSAIVVGCVGDAVGLGAVAGVVLNNRHLIRGDDSGAQVAGGIISKLAP